MFRKRNKTLAYAAVALAALAALYFFVRPVPEERSTVSPASEVNAPDEGAAIVAVTVPTGFSPDEKPGMRAVEGNCAACHGEAAIKLGEALYQESCARLAWMRDL